MSGCTQVWATGTEEIPCPVASRLLWIGAEADVAFARHGASSPLSCEVTACSSLEQGLAWLATNTCDLILLDLDRQPPYSCREIATLVAAAGEGLVLVVINERQGEQAADAMRCGAIDYVIKPFSARQLSDAILSALRLGQATHNLVSVSQVSKQVLQLARRAAKTSASVLISGESGTGKERLARYIHDMSERSDKPFVAINCAAIPESMLESILFGHAKGAFTGAVVAQPGKFEMANGGTLLLDEISELPLTLQAKLLRVLQEKEVERLGSHRLIPLDVRIIAASNRDLREQVACGEFREDLFYRLDVLPLSWPALRDRPDDILPLARFFLDRYAQQQGYRFSADAEAHLQAHPWPGNVRELENVIQRALVMARGLHIQAVDLMLPGSLPPQDVSCSPEAECLSDSRRQAEFRFVLETLRRCNGHRTRTAEALGMTTRALRYKLAAMREQGIDIEQQIQQ